jgi:hypothetical protein
MIIKQTNRLKTLNYISNYQTDFSLSHISNLNIKLANSSNYFFTLTLLQLIAQQSPVQSPVNENHEEIAKAFINMTFISIYL